MALLSSHRDHLRLAWNAVREHGRLAEDVVVAHIQAYAEAHGRRASYHDTMTRFWVRLIAHALAARPEVTDFDGFLAAFPQLLDKELFLRHWSREAMFASEARAAWRAPDVVPLPF